MYGQWKNDDTSIKNKFLFKGPISVCPEKPSLTGMGNRIISRNVMKYNHKILSQTY